METPESFIIQNVTLGPHYVSDLRIQFDPLAVVDLTWEDHKIVKASKDLRNSLRMGLLKQISQQQWETILEKQSFKEKKELLKQQNNQNLRQVDVDGKTIEAEQIDAEKASRVNKDVVSTAGYANDSLSYAMALDIAQTKAQLGGEDLSVEDFAERVQRDPGIVNKLLSEQKYLDNMSVTSGDPNRAKAYVTQPPTNTLGGTNVQKMQMSNQPGKSTADFDYDGGDDDYAIADAIDLESEIGSDEKGSIRRV